MLDTFFKWLASTPSSIALHESFYLWPAIESVHVITLTLFVGFSAMFDLRLLGVAFNQVPVSKFARRILPWTVAGFVMMVLSGIGVFYANPVHFYHSMFFRVKIVLLILAGLTAWVLHSGIWLRVADWDLTEITPRAARIAGAASLALWIFIIFAGRLIAYNWFDCDTTHLSVVRWISDCEALQEPSQPAP